MKILGIESSCDETGVAVFDTEFGLLAHKIHSQIDLHDAYGGVVPELASRDHVRRLPLLVKQTLQEAKLSLKDLDAVCYTAGPGLAGALLVGASYAEALAFSLNITAMPIHHLEGHLLSPLLSQNPPSFPFVALLVSGGHTQLMQVQNVAQYQLLGETLDDAAGEAFDKTAKMLGLRYPGGAELAKLAMQGSAGVFRLPRPLLHSNNLDFSFSGLKTAVLNVIHSASWTQEQSADLACEFQQAVVDVLVEKCSKALKQQKINTLVVAGGVSANQLLRAKLDERARLNGFKVFYPELALCTDNGAMIAFAGALRFDQHYAYHLPSLAIQVYPRWKLTDISKGCV